MHINIYTSTSTPLYAQIVEEIKNQILTKKLTEDEMLPSIRFLAKELKISVITTAKAYEELERQGFVYTIVGKGSFVKGQNRDIIRKEYLSQIAGKLKEAKNLANSCGITTDEILKLLEQMEKN